MCTHKEDSKQQETGGVSGILSKRQAGGKDTVVDVKDIVIGGDKIEPRCARACGSPRRRRCAQQPPCFHPHLWWQQDQAQEGAELCSVRSSLAVFYVCLRSRQSVASALEMSGPQGLYAAQDVRPTGPICSLYTA